MSGPGQRDRAMRICVLLHAAPGPSETFLRRHIEGLRADLVAPVVDPARLAGWTWKPPAWSLPPPNRLRRFAKRTWNRIRSRTTGVRGPRWSKAMQNLWRTYLDERKPDVVLAEFGHNGMVAMDACRKTGTPLVVHFHGFDASALFRIPAYRRRLPELFDAAHAVIVVGSPMRDTLIAAGCEPVRIHLIPCGADVRNIPRADRVGEPPCRFIAVGRFTEGKGPLLTLEAFKRCREEVGDVTLDMIGAGELLSAAQRWVQRNGLEHAVTLHGEQSSPFVYERLRRSSVFVQHSVTSGLGWIEGWGVSIAEGAAAGLPVIATRLGGIPDQVVDGQTGVLVEPGDWVAMGDAMIMLARDPNRRQRMGEAGRANIEAVGDAAKQMEKLKDVLQQAMQCREKIA